MPQTTINNGDAGSAVRAAINAMFAELYGAEAAAFGALPAAGSAVAGRRYTVTGPIVTGGYRGTQWVTDGTLWYPAHDQRIVMATDYVDGVIGGTTTDQKLREVLLPAGLLRGARFVHVFHKASFSASDTNARTVRFRLGTTGTDTDGLMAAAGSVSANQQQTHHVLLASATGASTLRHITTNAALTVATETGAAVTSGRAADQTVADLTQALYLTAWVQQGAAPTSTVRSDVFFLRVG